MQKEKLAMEKEKLENGGANPKKKKLEQAEKRKRETI